MSARAVTRSRVVHLDRMPLAARAELEAELADVYLATFVGPTRSQVIEHFVRRGPNSRTIVMYDEHDAVVGFATSVHLRCRVDGREYAVLDSGVYMLPGVRGGAARAIGSGVAKGLQHVLRHPRVPSCSISVALTPRSYRRALEGLPSLLPRPGAGIPEHADALVRAFAAAKGWVPVGEDPWVVHRTSMEVRSRDPARVERAGSGSDPLSRYYLDRNPGYERGHGLLTYTTLSPANVATALATRLARGARRRPAEN